MMKIFVAQLNYKIGDFQGNFEKIATAIERAKRANGDLIVFNELALSGFFPYDLLNYNSFFSTCDKYLEKIRMLSDNIGILIGSPRKEGKNGEVKLFNSAFLFSDNQKVALVDKLNSRLDHNKKEHVYFSTSEGIQMIEFKGVQMAITVGCVFGEMKQTKWIYHQIKTCHLHVNLNATAFTYSASTEFNRIILNVKDFVPTIICNAIGSSDDGLYIGSSQVLNQEKSIVLTLKKYQEDLQYCLFNKNLDFESENPMRLASSVFSKEFNPELNIKDIYDTLIFGIQDYFKRNGFSKAVLGSSGGIDSAVVLALACQALNSENVLSLLMPSAFSTGHSIQDAEHLSENLKSPFHILPINDVYDSILNTLQPLFLNLPFSVAEENIQARIRCLLLMAESNKFGSILLNTSNKSEASVGYGTLYGDTAGSLSVLGDVYKTQVYALARYINRDKELIPNHILTKPPSAELRPDQVDSDSLPDYDILDSLLFQHIEMKQDEPALIALGFESSLVKKILKMVNQCEFKRKQFCPILKVSTMAFGTDRVIPINNSFFKGK